METDEAVCAQIDEAVALWRQGDCVLGEQWFLYRLNPNSPLTDDATAAAKQGVDTAESSVFGLMISSQTCDIVRSCKDRPFIEVNPLVEVDADRFSEIQRGVRPRYALVPGVADKWLVEDLDRIMTVEKSVVANWDRTPGCSTDSQVRQLSLALARKRARFAFPDEFVILAQALTKRMSKKHGKQSAEGRALRSLREIRIQASPSWDAESVEITLLFIRNEDQPDFEDKDWNEYLEQWLGLIPSDDRFIVDGIVQTLDDLTARDYVESDPLDLDHLSSPSE